MSSRISSHSVAISVSECVHISVVLAFLLAGGPNMTETLADRLSELDAQYIHTFTLRDQSQGSSGFVESTCLKGVTLAGVVASCGTVTQLPSLTATTNDDIHAPGSICAVLL